MFVLSLASLVTRTPVIGSAVPSPAGSKRLLAGFCAVFLGILGVHKFVLGYNRQGAILLATFLLTLGLASLLTGIVVVIEGIVYLSQSDDDFVDNYQSRRRVWF